MKLKIFLIQIIFLFPFWNMNAETGSPEDKKSDQNSENKKVGVIVFVKGDVKIANKRLKNGDLVQNGETIKTGEKSVCDLQIVSSKSPIVIRIHEKANFTFQETKTDDTVNFKSVVDSGKIQFNVSKLGDKEKMQVVTPTTIAGVRGTRLETNIRANGLERTLVAEGKITSRTRVAKIEDIEEETLSKNKTLSDIAKSIKSNEKEISIGNYADYSRGSVDEFLTSTGLKEALDSSDDDTLSETLDKTIKDPKFKASMESTFKKIANTDINKIDPSVAKKRNDAYEELISIDPRFIDRKNYLQDILKQRNREREFISAIRKLQEENEMLKKELDKYNTNSKPTNEPSKK